MKKNLRSLLALVMLVLFGGRVFGAAQVTPLEIGAAAPNFDLPGVDGRNHTLHEYDKAGLLVVVFTCNHCPTAQAYEDRIKKLYADYKDKGVALVAISPNNPAAVRLDEQGYTDLGDSLPEMKIRAKDQDFQFPYLYDGDTQTVAHAYGCIATPHVFIFDQSRKLRYEGRIDDSQVREVHTHDAADAIEALLAGKPVPVARTRVFGCSTKWIEKSDAARKAVEKWNAEPVTLNTIDLAGVKDLSKNDTKNLRLVNIWATWCGPCVAELPDLNDLQRMYRRRGFELVTLSVDEPAKKDRALDFLKEKHIAATNFLVTSDDHDALANALDKEWPGPVPYTVLIAPGGKILYRHTGQVDLLELRQAIVGFLGRTYANDPDRR
ncbi:MAG TPA: redoxin domain-containing protein [Tepidisphaeraceae bacterium]|nr:redoxin domain-containing protein [Tepidisphaeraceae bacterium]